MSEDGSGSSERDPIQDARILIAAAVAAAGGKIVITEAVLHQVNGSVLSRTIGADGSLVFELVEDPLKRLVF
jgi:hypothetical protein